MSGGEVYRDVGRWLRFAEGDLRGAEALTERRDILPYLACFHAQQCAEKAVKNSLVFLQIDFPKTHDLQLLCEHLPEGWTLAGDPARFAALSVWAVEPRYPSDLPEATDADAEAAIEQARAKSTKRPSKTSKGADTLRRTQFETNTTRPKENL